MKGHRTQDIVAKMNGCELARLAIQHARDAIEDGKVDHGLAHEIGARARSFTGEEQRRYRDALAEARDIQGVGLAVVPTTTVLAIAEHCAREASAGWECAADFARQFAQHCEEVAKSVARSEPEAADQLIADARIVRDFFDLAKRKAADQEAIRESVTTTRRELLSGLQAHEDSLARKIGNDIDALPAGIRQLTRSAE